MTFSRRKTLALIGGGCVLAAGGAAAGFVTTRTPERALEPWARAGAGYADPRMRALSYAILAPNPHNLQPWMVDLAGDDTVMLYRDPARSLKETDPFDRQITIGLGCFLEQMRVTAAQDGLEVTFDLYPEGEETDRPVAMARFAEGADPDPLFDHVLARRSLKEPFDVERAVAADDLARVTGEASGLARAEFTTEASRVAAIRDLTIAAWEVETETPRTMQESVDLMRFGKSEIEANPDGIDMGGAFLESLMLAGMLSREALSDPQSGASKSGAKMYHGMLSATPAYLWLCTPSNDRAAQIAAGRAWLRVNLAATGAGLGLHPVSQCLQEFAEMAGHYTRVHEMLGKPGETVQMLGRVGYGPELPPSPRWPLETKLLNA